MKMESSQSYKEYNYLDTKLDFSSEVNIQRFCLIGI